MIITDKERQELVALELILKNIAEPDPVKAAAEEMTKDKLSGAFRFNDGLVSRMIVENDRLTNELVMMQGRIYSLESDIKLLIKTLSQLRGYNQDFENLKQKHAIY